LLSSLYIIFLPRVNYSIINMRSLFYTLLHKIVDNLRQNTKNILPSKEYNIFQEFGKVQDEMFCGGKSVVHLTSSPSCQNGTSASLYKIGY
jgi:hypothetical protein